MCFCVVFLFRGVFVILLFEIGLALFCLFDYSLFVLFFVVARVF